METLIGILFALALGAASYVPVHLAFSLARRRPEKAAVAGILALLFFGLGN